MSTKTRGPLALEKTDVAIRFLVRRGPVDRRRLVLVLYLVDLEAHRWMGRSVSALEWTYAEDGPFDTAFYQHLARLEAAGLVREEDRGWTVRYAAGDATPPDLEANLSPGERYLLGWVERETDPLSTEALLERVRESDPVRAGSPRRPIDLSIVDRAGPAAIEADGVPGAARLYDLDAIIEGRESADRGELRPADEVFDELQARSQRRDDT